MQAIISKGVRRNFLSRGCETFVFRDRQTMNTGAQNCAVSGSVDLFFFLLRSIMEVV